MKDHAAKKLVEEFSRDLKTLQADIHQLNDAIDHLETAEDGIRVCGEEIEEEESFLGRLSTIMEEKGNTLNKEHIRQLLNQIGNLQSDLREVDSELSEAKDEVKNVRENIDGMKDHLHSLL